ncbi:MAG: gene transfer agent family protein [Mesorhizobium sp.]|nr:MAG: gene transfer agent family protein [Mesorhizobium sp.]
MSRDASIELEWGDGLHSFRLAWGQLIKLQEACDCGPFVLLDRLMMGRWKVEEIREVIRWGLIGGGMSVADASKLMKLYVEAIPPFENLLTAQKVLSAGVAGAPDESPGETEAANLTETPSTISPTVS